jgi:acyl carrier protein
VLGTPSGKLLHDDFLALGGDSLLATRIIVRVRDIVGADVPLREMFAAATVADQAEALGRATEPRRDGG